MICNCIGFRLGKITCCNSKILATYTMSRWHTPFWRREGLKVPQKQPKRGRLWLNDGSCIRLRPMHKDHVWSYDFVMARTSDGRAIRILNIMDEHTR